MIKSIRDWYQRYLSDPEAIVLVVLLVVIFGLIIFMGDILAPVLISIVLAYLLEWLVNRLERWRMPRLPAVVIVFMGFMGLFLVFFLVLLPLLGKQLAKLFEEMPYMVEQGQQALMGLSQRFPEIFPAGEVESVIGSTMTDVKSWGKVVLAASLTSITSLITWLVYLVLVPLLVFFFLKDKDKILGWLGGFLPRRRSVLRKVSTEVNMQIANYIRGKVAEIIIVGLATYIVFSYFGLAYAGLLAALVGLSSLIPYVGAVVVTIPIIIVAFFQWGFGHQFTYLVIAYLIVQALDSNVLVPLLFSEAVNIHPVAIIVATLFFGGIWGFWGVFFAIPLATLIKAVINAWPQRRNHHYPITTTVEH